MTARLYDMKSTVLPPNAAALTRDLHALGVYEPRVLAMGEVIDDARALLEHVLDARDLAAIGPAALAAGATANDVARILGRWIESVVDETTDLGDHEQAVHAALTLCASTAPDGDLAYFLGRQLVGARGGALVMATGYAVALVGRRARVGAATPAAMAGDLVRVVVERSHGQLFAAARLDALVEIAREELVRAACPPPDATEGARAR